MKKDVWYSSLRAWTLLNGYLKIVFNAYAIDSLTDHGPNEGYPIVSHANHNSDSVGCCSVSVYTYRYACYEIIYYRFLHLQKHPYWYGDTVWRKMVDSTLTNLDLKYIYIS